MASSIFALEVCIPFQPGDALHTSLRQLLREHPQSASFQQKWQIYRRAADLLLEATPRIEKGCWDFFDDHQRAQNDFQMWCNGLLTEEGARPEPSGPPDPYRGEPRYLTFTAAVLLMQGTPTERTLAQRCTIPEQYLWRRDTFHHIIGGLPHINFASVMGDTLYLIPRDDEWGLTKEDLLQEKFKYLRNLA
jgi:hypothetical protein